MKNKQLRLALILALGCTAAQARYQDKHDNNQNDEHPATTVLLWAPRVAKDAGQLGADTISGGHATERGDNYGDTLGQDVKFLAADTALAGIYSRDHNENGSLRNSDNRRGVSSSRSNNSSSKHRSFQQWRRDHRENDSNNNR